MHDELSAIRPLFQEHDPQRVFDVAMYAVRDAAGLFTGAQDVHKAQPLDRSTSSKVSCRAVTLPVTTIISNPQKALRQTMHPEPKPTKI